MRSSPWRAVGAHGLVLSSMMLLSSCGGVGSPSPTADQPPQVVLAPTAAPPSPDPRSALATAPATAGMPDTPEPAPTASPPTEIPIVLSLEERRQIFEDVWGTVSENYLYADFRGVDWESLHAEYVPRIESAESREEFYQALNEMVAQLGDNHSRFVAPADVPAEDASVTGREMSVGIGIATRPRRDGAFIQLVFPDSPADRAGIRPRDRILAVDNRPYLESDGDLEGSAGTLVRLTVVRPGEKPRDVVLERQEVQARITPYYRRFPGDIGYVSIPTLWANDMGEQVSGALTDLVASGTLRGVVVDVRSNRGGWGEVLSEVLSHFVRGQAGTFFGREHVRPLVIAPPAGPDLRRTPVVVLIDSETASYAELLAAILQHEAGAIVIGEHSAGNTETIYAHAFEDGSRLWLAQEGFRLRDGASLEGVGVVPDVQLELDWTRYSEDDDPQLLEALRLLGGGPK